MYSPSLEMGSSFLFRGKMVTVGSPVTKYIVLEIEGQQEPLFMTTAKFYEDAQNDLVKEPEAKQILVDFSELITQEERDLAQKYQDYLTPLLSESHPFGMNTRKRVTDQVAAKRGDTDKNKPSPSTLFNWYKKLTSDEVKGNFAAMVAPKRRTRGRQAPDWAQDMFHDFVYEHFLQPIKDRALSKTKTIENFRKAYTKILNDLFETEEDRKKADLLSESTCYDILTEYDPVEVCIIREGHSVAVKRYRTSTEHFVAERPLELIQIDAVHLNLALRDEDGNYLGMVVVYFAIDVCTRAILGYVISIAKTRREDLSSAVDLIKSVIQPKKKPSHTVNDWPLFGIPEKVQHDSGVFRSEHFQAFLQAAGSHPHQNPAGLSWFNAIIERFHRTFRDQCCKQIPGYEGRRTDETKDTTNIKLVPYATPDQLQRLIEAYILDVYHQTPHKGLGGETPQQACDRLRGFVRLPAPALVQKLMKFRGVKCSGVIQGHKGIEYNGVYYMDTTKKLLKLWDKLGGGKGRQNPRVDFFASDLDISMISVVNPIENRLFEVPCTSVKEKRSLAEHKARKKNKSGKPVEIAQTMTPIVEEIQGYKEETELKKAKKKRERAQKKREKQVLEDALHDADGGQYISPEKLDDIIEENAAGINEPPELINDEGNNVAKNLPERPKRRSKKIRISKLEV